LKSPVPLSYGERAREGTGQARASLADAGIPFAIAATRAEANAMTALTTTIHQPPGQQVEARPPVPRTPRVPPVDL